MATFTTDPETGDLHAARTEGYMPALSSMITPVEHSIAFNRQSGDYIGYALQHFDEVRQLHLIVLDGDMDLCEVKSEIELSFDEAKLLRSFLNRKEIVEILSQH